MDVDYQNSGSLRAFGLLYRLLLNKVPVSWCIVDGKTLYTGSTAFPASPGNSVDFTASAVDLVTSAVITNHGYRGGPFVIDSAFATQATSIVTAFNAGQTNKVTVHRATAGFSAPVSRRLIAAPNIGINNDGNAPIAFGYLNAAGIPDSKGNAWTTSSPDVFTPAQVAGPSLTTNDDGALFGPNGYPVYCQFMSMHWTVDRTALNDAAIAEMASFLRYPTHLFAECQAVSMIEDDNNGHFVTTDNGTGEPSSAVACFKTPDDGVCTAAQPSAVTFLQSSLPFAQLDGPFQTVGGSEPAYGWAPGSTYFNTGIVMMRSASVTQPGLQDLWMTGYAGSSCSVNDEGSICAGAGGKVSYLGGHQYSTAVPLTKNPQTQGTRLFLNSLFEADCTVSNGQPVISLVDSAPAQVTTPQITFSLTWSNNGPGIATQGVITDTLPAGSTFVSATNGGTLSGSTVSWRLNDIGPYTSAIVSFTVSVSNAGTYANQAALAYVVGNNKDTVTSNQTSTVYCIPTASCPSPDNCGTLPDGCGGTVSCGVGCQGGQTCGGGGTPNVCGQGACVPLTQCPAGDDCGTVSDGCGGTVTCPPGCTSPQTCGGSGTANVCGCTPIASCPSGDNCGSLPDGCGGSVSCGSSCPSGQTCGGGGTANVCGAPPCQPLTSCPPADSCGTVSDGCGGTVPCGQCSGLYTCGGGGTPNVCGGCTPITTCPSNDNCGTIPDGCGGTVFCGAPCTGSETCGGGGTPNVCGGGTCVPLTACPGQQNCGSISDGCGGSITCGSDTCPSGQACVQNVCTDVSSDAGGGGSGDAGGVADASEAAAGGDDTGLGVDSSGSDDGGSGSATDGSASDGSTGAGTGEAGESGVLIADAMASEDGSSPVGDDASAGVDSGGNGDGSGNAAAREGSPSGCSCRTAGGADRSWPHAPVAGLGALAFVAMRRRRRPAPKRPSAPRADG